MTVSTKRSEVEELADSLFEDLMQEFWDSASDFAFDNLKESKWEDFYEALAEKLKNY